MTKNECCNKTTSKRKINFTTIHLSNLKQINGGLNALKSLEDLFVSLHSQS